MHFPLFIGVLCLSFFWYTLLCVLSSFAIILKRERERERERERDRERELVVLFLLSYGCLVVVNVLWLFLRVPWVGLQFVIVVFPDYTHLLFA